MRRCVREVWIGIGFPRDPTTKPQERTDLLSSGDCKNNTGAYWRRCTGKGNYPVNYFIVCLYSGEINEESVGPVL